MKKIRLAKQTERCKLAAIQEVKITLASLLTGILIIFNDNFLKMKMCFFGLLMNFR